MSGDGVDARAREFIDNCLALARAHGYDGQPAQPQYEEAVGAVARTARCLMGTGRSAAQKAAWDREPAAEWLPLTVTGPDAHGQRRWRCDNHGHAIAHSAWSQEATSRAVARHMKRYHPARDAGAETERIT